MNKSQLLWYLRLIPKYAGILGLAGIVLLGFAAVLYTQDLKPYEKDLANREAELERKFNSLRTPIIASTVSAELPKLNQADTFTFFLRRMNEIASKDQVALNQVDYKSQIEADGKLKRYSLQFPASARYMQFRRFTAALQQIPGVRIEAVNLQRQVIGEEQLSVQMQLSYLTEVR
ncbi:hypothetical protein HQ393_08015 [Chitinibacter bivalviorum]|uniref:Type 4a pilus biogenesis protein PilO n=1 Tax=Chitinibacter bivalviorum TaxID=2739434 RepID=A0A7H9BIX8_9NEIS|nr:hypothetical protein [Chitinibacter bivalviorum]QLG88198.1 hypothetical protein HQ393_08015 [Chitinibacter bivalviorum]